MRSRRHEADAIVSAVRTRGAIQPDTLSELLQLLAAKTAYESHVAVEVVTPTMVKTIDNEADAQETIRRLCAAPLAQIDDKLAPYRQIVTQAADKLIREIAESLRKLAAKYPEPPTEGCSKQWDYYEMLTDELEKL